METKTHAVLAGAYRGKGAALLTHSSTDGGETALCRSIKAGHLADEYADDSTAAPTCPRCLAKDARFASRK